MGGNGNAGATFRQATSDVHIPAARSASNSNAIQSLGNSTRDSDGKLVTWNGHRVTLINGEPCFKDSAGRWSKIWFASPVQWTKDPDLPSSAYDANAEIAYESLRTHGAFPRGEMPDVPPKREWCSWNF